jgi:hypothetical protein
MHKHSSVRIHCMMKSKVMGRMRISAPLSARYCKAQRRTLENFVHTSAWASGLISWGHAIIGNLACVSVVEISMS